jgi:hypothetical protein
MSSATMSVLPLKAAMLTAVKSLESCGSSSN